MPGICTNRCDTTTLEPHKRPQFVPGEPAESELYLRTASEFAEDRIPPYNAGIDLRYPCSFSPGIATARCREASLLHRVERDHKVMSTSSDCASKVEGYARDVVEGKARVREFIEQGQARKT